MSICKLSKDIKNKMERELRQYYENKKQLDILKKDKTASTRRYIYLEKRLEYVENVYNKLKPFEKEVYDLIFKHNYDVLYIETHKNISKTTYYNVLNKSIVLLAEEWGEL